MKRIIVLMLAIFCMLIVLAACENINEHPDIDNGSTIEGPFTNDNSNDFANSIPAKIDDDILQTCYEFAKSLGYEPKNKEKYTSVLLGESNVASVSVDDDAKKDMVDENDYLIIFEEARIVIDADTKIALGTIPYV